ncbi:J domain-containing protein [Kribbella sp. NPDC003505]|uniref:J domain-containing protein n=1 Tax=Kribbella sp. NPDC003505 TaxID=3154448 RepID=UPI0033B8BF50
MGGADHYEVLNVERTASTAEIKSAYRKLVRQVHPDQGGNAALFRLVQDAWNTLSDPAKRAAYDRGLDRPAEPLRSPGPDSRHDPGAWHDRGPGRDPDPEPEPEPTWTWSTDQPWTTEQADEQPWSSEQPLSGDSARPVDAGVVQVRPAFGRWRVPALVALTGLTALIVWFAVTTEYHGFWDFALGVGLVGMIVVALPPHWSRRVPIGALLKGLGILTAVLYLAMLLLAKDSLTTLDRILVGTLLAGLVVTRVLTGRWSKAHALDRAIDRTAAYEFNLWGRPGEPLVDDALAAPITPYDVLLQRRTANLLDPVITALPAAKLVHGAQLGAVAVDHMLLNGHRVALIVSLVGPPGVYSLDAYGSLALNGQPLDSPAAALEAAVTSWRGRLRTAEVRGFLIVHPSADGRITTRPTTDTAVTCLPARSAADELLTWLRPEGNFLDRRLLYDVLHRAPYGLI